jgi:AcrR family transcriptional regulator
MPKTVKTKQKASADKGAGGGVRHALVEREILERAAALFAERGFAGTSLQDVANALGMSRTAIYYYVPSKEAILGRLVEKLSQHDAAALEAIRNKRSLGPSEKVRAMALQLSENAGENPRQTRILSENAHHLPPALAKTNRAAEAAVITHLQAAIDEGMRKGEFRPIDSRTAALAIAGMCIWTAWWFQADSSQLTAGQVAAQIAEQALHSVLSESQGGRGTPAELLKSMREQITQLERLLDTPA